MHPSPTRPERRSITPEDRMAHKVEGGSPAPRTSPHRRRRPVGEPPPLPRDLRGPATLWILTLILLGAIYVWGKYGGPTAGHFQRWLEDRKSTRLNSSHVAT